MKSSAKLLKPSRSFQIFRNLSIHFSEETRDDTSSFMSPMPRELRSTSFENADLLSPLGSDDSEDWDDSDETNSARISFIECGEIIGTFPEPPIFKSQTSPSRRHGLDWPPIPAAFLELSPDERSHDRTSSTRRNLKQAHGRSPAPSPRSIHHGPLQYSTTCIPFDLLSRTDQTNRFDGSPSSSSLLRSSSPSLGSSTSLRLSLTSSSPRPHLARSRSCNLLSRLCTFETCSVLSGSTTPSGRRPSTNASLQDLRAPSPAPNLPKTSPSSSPSPSSFRQVILHVPGLEHRLMKSPCSTFASEDDVANDGNSHVPYGRF